MSEITARRLGIASIIAGALMPVAIAALIAVGVIQGIAGDDDVLTKAIGSSTSYALGFAAAVGVCIGPLAAVVLGCFALKTAPGKVGLALGVFGLLLLVLIIALGVIVQVTGILPS